MSGNVFFLRQAAAVTLGTSLSSTSADRTHEEEQVSDTQEPTTLDKVLSAVENSKQEVLDAVESVEKGNRGIREPSGHRRSSRLMNLYLPQVFHQ